VSNFDHELYGKIKLMREAKTDQLFILKENSFLDEDKVN